MRVLASYESFRGLSELLGVLGIFRKFFFQNVRKVFLVIYSPLVNKYISVLKNYVSFSVFVFGRNFLSKHDWDQKEVIQPLYHFKKICEFPEFAHPSAAPYRHNKIYSENCPESVFLYYIIVVAWSELSCNFMFDSPWKCDQLTTHFFFL